MDDKNFYEHKWTIQYWYAYGPIKFEEKTFIYRCPEDLEDACFSLPSDLKENCVIKQIEIMPKTKTILILYKKRGE